MAAFLAAAVLAGCGHEAVDRVDQVECEVAGDGGLAVWVRAPEVWRHGRRLPVLVRVHAATSVGFDEDPLPTPAALGEGAAVVRFLDPGESFEGHASGGADGASRIEAVRCVVDHAIASFPDASAVVVTGLSAGGNTVLLASDTLPADAFVLWESPLVDQLWMNEPAPKGVVDPTFTPGTCTLDGGCPFPGRAERLRWIPGQLFHDLDGDGLLDDDEPAFNPPPDPVSGKNMVSREIFAEVNAHEATVFAGDVPPTWPTAIELDSWWATRDATPALQALRDGGGGRFVWIGTAEDHVQSVHEHLRLAQEGFAGAEWWRINPDAAYVAALGATVDERPAFAAVADPEADGALPELPNATLLLAAELELADRVWADRWEPDLDAVIERR